jgi:hypothetical protein
MLCRSVRLGIYRCCLRARARAPARPHVFRGEPARGADQAVGRGGNLKDGGRGGKTGLGATLWIVAVSAKGIVAVSAKGYCRL